MACISKANQARIDAIVSKYSDSKGFITLTADDLVKAFAPKTKAPKRTRDPTKPVRPPSAFKMWKDDVCDSVEAELQTSHPDCKITKRQLNEQLKAQWDNMSKDEKTPYDNLVKVKMNDYNDELKVWNAENGVIAKPNYKKFDISEDPPKTPDGWADYILGFIEGSPIDPETGKKLTKGFKTLEEAIQKADELGANGITRTRVGYRVRIGTSVSNTESSRAKGELSWLRK